MTCLTRWLRKRRIARLEVQLAHYREFASSYETIFHQLKTFAESELSLLCTARAKVAETAKLLEQLKKEIE